MLSVLDEVLKVASCNARRSVRVGFAHRHPPEADHLSCFSLPQSDGRDGFA